MKSNLILIAIICLVCIN